LNKISGIYKILNNITNDVYIGQSKNLNQREKIHFSVLKRRKHENPYLQNAFDKYGEKNFIFEIIQELENDQEQLNLMEIYWIAYYNSFKDDGGGYNLTRGGDCIILSEDTKKRMSISKKGIIPWNTGLKTSESTKRKQSLATKGVPKSEETRKKMSIAQTGRKYSEEQNKRNSERQKGEKHWNFGGHHSEETKNKIGEGNKGKIISEESKQKISIANSGKYPSEETKQKMSESQTGRTHSEETKQKMSESGKKAWAKRKQEQQENDLTENGE